MKNISLRISPTALKKSFYKFLHRFHVVVFVVIALGGLAISVFILNTIIISSSDTSQFSSEGTTPEFDQETINRVEELRTRDQSDGPLTLPQGRTNPFVE